MKRYFGCIVIYFMYLIFVLTTATAIADETAEDKGKKEAPMKHLTMDEIVVTDEAIKEPTTTVIGAKTVERGKNTNIPDVLEFEAGIDVNRKALVGDTGDTLKIRGLSGNRIMMNVDGRSVNAAGVQGGYFIDFSTIPIDNIEKVEVIYGGSSVKYGNNAGGGVINVITKRPTERPTFSFYGNYGDVSDMQNYRINHTYKIGPVGYSIAGSYQRANPYLWNNDYEAKNIGGKLYIDMPFKGELTFGFQYTDVTRGFAIQNRLSTNPNDPYFHVKRNSDAPLSFGESFSPGAGNLTTPGPGANWNKTKYLYDLGYTQQIGPALVLFKAYKNYENRDEKNYSANWLNTKYPNGRLILDRTVSSDRSFGGSLEFVVPVKSHEIDAGIDRKIIATGGQDVHYVDNSYHVGKTVTSYGNSSEAHMWGFFIQDSWRVTDKLLLTPGIRYDLYRSPQYNAGQLEDDGVSLSLTGTYRFTESDNLTASIYQKYLTPSAPDAAWWSDGYGLYYTEPLKVEKNNAAELAYQHNFSPKDSIRLSAYYYGIDDYISRFSRTDGRGCYNIKKVELIGASLEGAAQIFPWMSARGNVTYQHSKKMGDSQDPAQLSDKLEYLPEWKGNLGLDFKLPYAVTFSAKERVVGITQTVYSYTVGTGKSATTRYNLVKLSPFATTDVEIKVPVTKHGEIGFFVENLFDKHYEERFGYALPGRIIGTSAKITF